MARALKCCRTGGAVLFVLLLTFFAGCQSDNAPADEDFAFEVTGDDDLVVAGEYASTPGSRKPPFQVIQIPDATATVGKLFQFTVPAGLIATNVDYYELAPLNTKAIPDWLLFDKQLGTFQGVPTYSDLGTVLLVLTAPRIAPFSDRLHLAIHVKLSENKSDLTCPKQSRTILSIITGKGVDEIKPKSRVMVIDNLARFLGLPTSVFKLAMQGTGKIAENSIILAGPGDKKPTSKKQSAIQVIVGCGGEMRKNYASIIPEIKDQSRDGTISEVTGLPVIGWKVAMESTHIRQRRQLANGAEQDVSYYDDDGEGDGSDDEYDETVTEVQITDVPVQPTPAAFPTTPKAIPEHHHRHHHGEVVPPDVTFPVPAIVPIVESFDVITTPTPTPLTTVRPTIKYMGEIMPDLIETKTESVAATPPLDPKPTDDRHNEPAKKDDPIAPIGTDNEYDDDDDDDEYDSYDAPIPTEQPTETSSVSSPSTKTANVTAAEPITEATIVTVPQETVTDIQTSTKVDEPVETSPFTPSTPMIMNVTSVMPSSTPEPTKPPTFLTTLIETEETTAATTLLPTTLEEVTVATVPRTAVPPSTVGVVYNSPPVISHRLKKMAVTAGKTFRFVVPNNTFSDSDGGPLYLSFLDAKGSPIKKTSWIQFNPTTREIYGLPLDDHVSKWDFIVRATDPEGAEISDILEIAVQHHKGRRTVSHAFTMKLRVEDKHMERTPIDWQFRVINGLLDVYGTNDPSQIVVLNVTTTEPLLFTWTNDTLPRNDCPKSEIDRLMGILAADSDGTPSELLQEKLAPEVRVKHVQYRGIGQCEAKLTPPPPPPKKVAENFSPVVRNQIDQINATVGELLAFTVPADTFFDPEDQTKMKISLLTMSRAPLPTDHWLQFDVNNRQFYGIPQNKDVGVLEYQLVCEDGGGLTATDSLVVKVHSSSALLKQPSVEFSMSIDISYEMLMDSATMKRKFVQKLAKLFNDSDTSAIVVVSISSNPTTITWINKTLTTNTCPNKEITKLRRVLLNNEEISDAVPNVMLPFEISGVGIRPTGVCLGGPTIIHPPDMPHTHDNDEDTADHIDPRDKTPTFDISPNHKPQPRPNPGKSRESTSGEDYLIVYVLPGVIILCMLLLAGIVACVLYRRRRRCGKLNVGDDERRSLRTKGIPVIFQDELEDKPEPGNKTPIIMKEEKPPLPPPEYSKRGDSPEEEALYQPPPPFPANRDSGRGVRPKATPTYRKPPPYVPP